MNMTFSIRLCVLALATTLATIHFDDRAVAQSGREPLACMNLALDYARQLARTEEVDALILAQQEVMQGLEGLAHDSARPPHERLEDARRLTGSREARELDRAIRSVERIYDNTRSIVAGWRGLYCPVATPDGGANLTGQERCDALAATFVDQLRIERRTPEQTRARESLETERQTILKSRVTRSDRNDLLDIWRFRSEGFVRLNNLERFRYLQGKAQELIEGLEKEGCISAEQS